MYCNLISLHLTSTLILTLPALINTQCPSTMSTVPMPQSHKTLCVKSFNVTATFCDAVKICHVNNMEIVSSKAVYVALRDNGMFTGKAYWIGLTDALNERDKSKDGWVWMKDGQLTAADDGFFAPPEPSHHFENCVLATNRVILDASCGVKADFHCYSNSDGSPVLSDRNSNCAKFNKAPIVTFVQPGLGCSVDVSSSLVTNRFLCGLSCRTSGADCVGFYWNSGRQECIILMYFDASVQLVYRNTQEMMQWEKFIRVFN